MAEAILLTPGQVVAGPDWEALAAQHGGVKSSQKREPTAEEKAAASKAAAAAAPLGEGEEPVPDDPRSWYIRYETNPIYRYYFADGTYVEARTSPNGTDYQIGEYKPSQKFQAAQKKEETAATSTAIPADAVPRVEGTPLPGGGFDNEQPVQVWRRPDGTVVKTEPLTGPERTKWEEDRQKSRNPGGKTDAQIEKEKKDAETKAEAQRKADDTTVVDVAYTGTGKSRTKITTYKSGRKVNEAAPTNATAVSTGQETRNGKTVKVTKYDDNTETVEELNSADTTTTISRNGKTFIQHNVKKPDGTSEVYHTDQAGNRVTLPDEGVGNLNDLPTYQPDLTKPGAGLMEYAKALDEYMAAHPEFTWEKRQTVLASAQAQAKQVTDEWNLGARILETQYQQNIAQRRDDMTQANSRASTATTHHQNAVALIEKFAPYLGVTPGDAGKMFMGMMASQLAAVTAAGGMKTSPQVEMDPRLTAFADSRMPGGAAQPPAVPGAAPAVAPAPAQAQADADMAAAVRARHAASGEPLPPPLLGPNPAAPAAQAPAAAAAPSGAPAAVDYTDMVTVQMPYEGAGTMQVPRAMVGEGPGQYAPSKGWRIMEGVAASPAATGTPNFSQPDGSFGIPPGELGPSAPPTTVSMDAPAMQDISMKAFGQPASWRERAQEQAGYFDQMPSPGNVAIGQAALGGLGATGSLFGGGFNAGAPVGQAPMALQSRIPGLTPEIDEQARRELMAEMGAA